MIEEHNFYIFDMDDMDRTKPGRWIEFLDYIQFHTWAAFNLPPKKMYAVMLLTPPQAADVCRILGGILTMSTTYNITRSI